jgi:acyl carrier protein phosphodiesterase
MPRRTCQGTLAEAPVNYLAHLFLADPTPESMLGNVLADFVKGKAHLALPPAVQEGVLLHRQVDKFTDNHPVTHRSIGRVRERWGWFSGILIDVFYDHFLALDWERYSSQPLRAFIDNAYGVLLAHQPLMPEHMQELVQRMVRDDRLMSYTGFDGIAVTLKRISRLIRRREVHLELAIEDLQRHHDALRADFHDFFPELVAFVQAQKTASRPTG